MGLGEQGRVTKEFLTKFHALESFREKAIMGMVYVKMNTASKQKIL